MKKKIIMRLGAITALTIPVVGLISCGEDSDATKAAKAMLEIMPNSIVEKQEWKIGGDKKTALKNIAKDISIIVDEKKPTENIDVTNTMRNFLEKQNKNIGNSLKKLKEDYPILKEKGSIASWAFKVKTAYDSASKKMVFELTAGGFIGKDKEQAVAKKDVTITFL